MSDDLKQSSTPASTHDDEKTFAHYREIVKGYDWTPSNGDVTTRVNHFTAAQEQNWISTLVRRDPALYEQLDLDEATLKRFLKGDPTPESEEFKKVELSQLVAEGMIDDATLASINEQSKTYQGLHAIAFHSVAHQFYKDYIKNKDVGNRDEAAEDLIIARKISQGVRRLTAGIEIHPGAQFGANCIIDHGSGIVIGETVEAGNNVFIYHDVTLGATSGGADGGARVAETNAFGIPRRHPKLMDDVFISKGSSVLGPITLGKGTKIAEGAGIEGMVITGEEVSIGKRAIVKSTTKGNVIIGNNVNIGAGAELYGDYRIYQGFTHNGEPLGVRDENGTPSLIIEDGVNIGVGAKIIGDIRIGKGATIDPGVRVTRNVAPGEHVVGEQPYLPGINAPEILEDGTSAGAGAPITLPRDQELQEANGKKKTQEITVRPLTSVMATWAEDMGKGFKKLIDGAGQAQPEPEGFGR